MNNLVKQQRLLLKMTQVELAQLAKVSARTIISIEQGRYKPSLILAYRLSLILNLSIQDLFLLPDHIKQEDI